MSQQIVNIPLPESTVPDFVNDPNIPMDRKRLMLDEYHRRMSQSQSQGNLPPMQNPQPQIVDVAPQSQPQPVMGNAGAQRRGVDWAGLLGTLGSYVSAAGSAYGAAANPSQGLLAATNALQKQTQNINQYKSMAPKYQQMGYDVSGYDPRRGGAGLTATPEKMIELESLIDQRKTNADYRQMMAEARMQQVQQKDQATQTVGDLMLFNPEFRARMNAQYDFRNGANSAILKRPVPKELLMNVLPKNVNMRYSGGLKSSKTSNVNVDYSGAGKGKGKDKKPATRLIVD